MTEEMKNLSRVSEVLTSNWYHCMFQCYSDIVFATFKFYSEKEEFAAATLPVTTGSISSPMGLGSDSLPVEIKLFNQKTYLADSMQFLLEYSLRFGKKGVFYLMPTFRGEDSDERHLNQFYHSECEIVGGLSDIIRLCEDYIKNVTRYVISQNYYKESVSEDKLSEVRSIINQENFQQITFDDAVKLLRDNNIKGVGNIDGVMTINSVGEKWLIKHFDGVVWLTKFPHKGVPFYQAYDKKDPNVALCADLLIGMGETLGCGERANYNDVLKSLDEHKVSHEEYEWYISMKKEFPLKTSGFGMGIERYIAWLFDIDDIRKIPYVYREKNKIIYP
ncbi:amino acid--tRNA ligase-related protein [Lactococcus lactis]|uniref:amino acid--tRNA ligase-related protein n=1 Tax=Lactococcus lactis TaxID=1358 RepID=UPI002078907B|nr:amino acid--tRNA ligase-related protein [Lactococcus lactis]USI47012.1 asparagine synthetase A [Lactococcus lactis]